MSDDPKRDSWVSVPVEWLTGQQLTRLRVRALDNHSVACPNCELGWFEHRINLDRHICIVCGYTGGPLGQSPVVTPP